MAKTVLITGASQGIGATCAELFAKMGYQVAVNYFSSADSANALTEKLSADGYIARAYYANVSKRSDVSTMFDAIHKDFGEVDILVNNAGVSLSGLFTDMSDDEWQKLMGINVNGAIYCAQHAISDMLKKHEGRIINISSIWGITGASCEVAYSMTKAALIGMTKALAKELGPSGITVNCVAPGVIDTKMNSALNESDLSDLCDETPLGRIGTTKDIASAVLYFASDEASFITGQVLSPNGGIVI